MIIFIIIALILIILLCIINTSKFKGIYGEFKLNLFIKTLTKKEEAYVYKNIIIQDENNNSSEIDLILVSKKGIFVIETKNYSGTIYGNDKQKDWVQVFNFGKQKYNFYSPVLQNKKHIDKLKEKLNDKNIDIINIIIFINNKINNISSNYVYTLKKFKAYYKQKENIYSFKFIKDLNIKIQNIKTNSISLKEHIENIEKKEKEYNQKIDLGLCPYCSSKLVLRKGKYGKFYGCSNFPKCKFTKKMR